MEPCPKCQSPHLWVDRPAGEVAYCRYCYPPSPSPSFPHDKLTVIDGELHPGWLEEEQPDAIPGCGLPWESACPETAPDRSAQLVDLANRLRIKAAQKSAREPLRASHGGSKMDHPQALKAIEDLEACHRCGSTTGILYAIPSHPQGWKRLDCTCGLTREFR